jgi:hypothetical protein
MVLATVARNDKEEVVARKGKEEVVTDVGGILEDRM